uniref:Uncharacterized protein n=1 Tax=Megaselia scalaris TaxID=36166 RepID=T1GKU3_MEGSC
MPWDADILKVPYTVVDTLNTVSVINRTIVNLLQRFNVPPVNGNTIYVEVITGFIRRSIKCNIKDDAPNLLTVGLTDLFDLGFVFQLSESVVRGIQGPNVPIPAKQPKQSMLNNRQFRKINHQHYQQKEVVVTYPNIAACKNWDETPVEINSNAPDSAVVTNVVNITPLETVDPIAIPEPGSTN